MTSCQRRNVKKHREIKNGEQCIALDISLEIYCLEKREVNSSESREYMVISGKGLTTSMILRTKSKNKKKKAGIYTTDITNQDFRKFLKEFKNSNNLGYKKK